MRATLRPCSASGMAQPMITSSISEGSRPGARRSAEFDQVADIKAVLLRIPACADQPHDILLHPVIDVDPAADVAEHAQIVKRCDFAAERRRSLGHQIQHRFFLIRRRVTDPYFHNKPIDLRFGQGIRAFLLDRILGREHEKRIGDLKRLPANRDLPLLHGLEQCGLHFRRSSVDFVG